jgi:hypothetical protein
VETSDLIASAGVTLILIAFLLNLAGRLERENAAYLWLNLVGAALACLASALVPFIPFVILEGVWALAALAGLIRLRMATSDASLG